ncbi:sigma-70 family RNA polymerase sigma factor [uncultured Microbacterium sp.]|uniref:sigma-70 family RNA polymerase sigma factor n=1 Tax=uncultured Microbacterium sp. TaxID=191216 RepID=UPI0028D50697|nr:sigma-70 family RNA polymerase sigma factor [uncultured Microbacterium sp.]
MAGDVGSSHVRTDFGELSDAELVRATRDGSRRAYAALYARHSVSALKYARTLTSSDADDVVSEAFLKVYSAIKAGRGPEEDFRYYMRSAVRNTYISMVRARRTDPAGDAIEDVVGDRGADVASLRSFDGSATARAFMSLPARWQEVLWYLEVEGYSREHTATLLGMNPNAVSALSFRAREALRTAWLQQHISVHSDLDRGCEAVTPLLGAYSRNGLSRRDRLRVEHHVTGCAHCTSVLEELSELLTPGRLALILLPFALAGGSLAAFASKLGSGAVASGAVASGVVAPTATATVFATVGGGSTAAGGAALTVVGKVAACAIVATMIVPPTQMLIVSAQHESITHHRSEISEHNADLGAVLLAGDVDIPVSIAAGGPDAGRVIEADSDTDSEAAEQPEPRGGRPEGAGAPESPAEGNSGPKPDAKPDAAKSNGGGKSEAPPTGTGNPATAPNANANPHATANGKGSGNPNPTDKGSQAGAADPSDAGNAGAEVGTIPDTATAPTATEGNPDVPGPAPSARSAASAAPTTGEASTQAAAPPVAASAATDAVGEAAVASTETVTPSGP